MVIEVGMQTSSKMYNKKESLFGDFAAESIRMILKFASDAAAYRIDRLSQSHA